MKTAKPPGHGLVVLPLLSPVPGADHGGVLIGWPKVALRNRDIRNKMMQQVKGWMFAGALVLVLPSQTLPQTPGHGGGAADPNKIDVVCLDAGHGGKDPGNLGTGRFKTTEKQVSLAVTRLVGKYITENFPDVKVIYTRDNDTFVELKERCEIANRNKADVFISIHCNANNDPSPHGCETYSMGLHKTEANMRVAMKENESILLEDDKGLKYDGFDPKDPESMIALSLRQNAFLDHSQELSHLVQTQLGKRVGRPDRGVKQAGFLVISYTSMPAILIELGFLTNKDEEDFLQSAKGQELLASGIYRAFKQYKAKMEGTDVDMTEAKVDSTAVAVPTPVVKDSGVRFKVQIITSSKRIELKPKNFAGLEGVEEMQGKDLWKYAVGNETTLDAARKVQERCREKGYEGCFIVAFKDGQRIDLQQAVTLTRTD